MVNGTENGRTRYLYRSGRVEFVLEADAVANKLADPLPVTANESNQGCKVKVRWWLIREDV